MTTPAARLSRLVKRAYVTGLVRGVEHGAALSRLLDRDVRVEWHRLAQAFDRLGVGREDRRAIMDQAVSDVWAALADGQDALGTLDRADDAWVELAAVDSVRELLLAALRRLPASADARDPLQKPVGK